MGYMGSCKKTRGVHFVIGDKISTQQDIDLARTMLQMPHSMSGYDMTPNVIVQISTKVTMTIRFLGFVDSLLSSEEQLWFPDQNVQDPDTWTFPHLIQLKHEYKKIVRISIVMFKNHLLQSKTLQLPRQTYFIYRPSQDFICLLRVIWSYFNRENQWAKGSTTVSTNFISSTHEVMGTLANKHCHCLKYADA
jgi:hypothetical protein